MTEPEASVTPHDLLTPLTVVRGWARTLLDSEVDDETRVAGLRAILDAAVRLEDAVRLVLDGAEIRQS